MSFRRGVAIAALIFAAAAPARSQSAAATAAPRSPRNANYVITATLDPRERTIKATETITWRNITATTATELQFHLYWNAWTSTRTTWMRERALGGSREFSRRADEWARIEVASVKMVAPNAADLTTAQHFITPDDDNGDDHTVMAVPLPQPVGPGGTVAVEVAWTAHVPRTFARTGAIGNFFFIAQWFPKLGVLQADGWNCHQFHAGTEFFSDYGVYDVSLTVPQRWIVGATGLERERRDNVDGTATHRYVQEDVHDFAWTTSPDYVERTARFEHPSLPAVDMRLLLQPEHLSQADRHFDATRTALKYYGEWFGPYPYGHITIVDPAYQSGAGGMEYPTLFTAGTRWLAPQHVTTPEGVTIHEAGHQFWYGIVGNNEFEDAWMDEGINTYSAARATAQVYEPNFLAFRVFGRFVPWVIRDVPLSREFDDDGAVGYRRDARSDVPSTPSFRYFPSTGGSITYFKTALWLNTLERWLGWSTVQRTLAAHFDRWKFKHPKPADFFAIASETAGRDLTPFFDQVYRSSNVFDYAVDSLDVTREDGQWRSTVVVRREGEALFPVDVRMTFENGEQVTEHWTDDARWRLFVYVGASPVETAEVDPNRVLLLDVNFTNNSVTRHPRAGKAATKWSLTWMVWLQDCLLSWAALV
ncbi:MAG TPA: M1 family metallopeptidase [Vicinamibacterales bacterium]